MLFDFSSIKLFCSLSKGYISIQIPGFNVIGSSPQSLKPRRLCELDKMGVKNRGINNLQNTRNLLFLSLSNRLSCWVKFEFSAQFLEAPKVNTCPAKSNINGINSSASSNVFFKKGLGRVALFTSVWTWLWFCLFP